MRGLDGRNGGVARPRVVTFDHAAFGGRAVRGEVNTGSELFAGVPKSELFA